MTQLAAPLQNTDAVGSLPENQRKEIAVNALSTLAPQAQQDAAQRAGLSRPGQGTTNVLWVILVVALSLLALVAGSYIVVTSDLTNRFTVFTTAVGILVAIFVPSPTQGR